MKQLTYTASRTINFCFFSNLCHGITVKDIVYALGTIV